MQLHLRHFALLALSAAAGCTDDGTTAGTTSAADAAQDMAAETSIALDAAPEANADIGRGEPEVSDAHSEAIDSPRIDGGLDAQDVDVADGRDAEAGDDGVADGGADHADALVDVAPDGLTCQPPAVLAYNMPGCGANAPPPYCQGPTDACLTPVCGCDGVTAGSGCGYATAPFAAWGPCADGGRPDAGSD